MPSLNKCSFIGNITAPITMRYTPTGDAIGNFTIACNETWKGKDGEKQESCEFIRIVVFGSLAENCSKFLGKGSLAYVEGKIETRKYTDLDDIIPF